MNQTEIHRSPHISYNTADMGIARQVKVNTLNAVHSNPII